MNVGKPGPVFNAVPISLAGDDLNFGAGNKPVDDLSPRALADVQPPAAVDVSLAGILVVIDGRGILRNFRQHARRHRRRAARCVILKNRDGSVRCERPRRGRFRPGSRDHGCEQQAEDHSHSLRESHLYSSRQAYWLFYPNLPGKLAKVFLSFRFFENHFKKTEGIFEGRENVPDSMMKRWYNPVNVCITALFQDDTGNTKDGSDLCRCRCMPG